MADFYRPVAPANMNFMGQPQQLIQPQLGYGQATPYGTLGSGGFDPTGGAAFGSLNGAGGGYGTISPAAFNFTGAGVTPPNPFVMGGAGMGGIGGQLGFNLPTLNLGLTGAQTLMGLYSGYQANKLAKDQFNFTKQYAEKNLANQTAAYNDRVETRENQRAVMQGRSREETEAEIARRRLTA